jgi:hypothetical protein
MLFSMHAMNISRFVDWISFQIQVISKNWSLINVTDGAWRGVFLYMLKYGKMCQKIQVFQQLNTGNTQMYINIYGALPVPFIPNFSVLEQTWLYFIAHRSVGFGLF